MREKKKLMLFQLVIHDRDSGGERVYTLFDGEPSFFNLPDREQEEFIKKEGSQIKQWISSAYQPHLLL